ncbi:Lrp/AsnC family transcriptional regulator [Tomitella fengzijianii]|uniref:Lrp/AsnC family transcriptional regulator n=1 Tax=Tomitella fengzijianii TaxID=2597660 RepID=A0A516X4A3_9ACTN|nr:Lrp/AsnC ligand binding domain-containing protein [Tomitella fengzijianii]QDQ97896.1 Lrp/AsnC family transcriptional regulator [Tomitella fengzijianii]
MITAIVLAAVEPATIPEAAQAIADIPGVESVYSCAGDVDIVAVVKVRDHEAVADVVTGGINKIAGIVRTTTHIAFRSYSSVDVEEAFSIGE